MSKPPFCAKCKQEHWRFVACTEAPARNELERKNKRGPDVWHRAVRADGLVDWRDRLVTVTRNGNTLLNKRTKTVVRGSLTGPDGWQPPDAA